MKIFMFEAVAREWGRKVADRLNLSIYFLQQIVSHNLRSLSVGPYVSLLFRNVFWDNYML